MTGRENASNPVPAPDFPQHIRRTFPGITRRAFPADTREDDSRAAPFAMRADGRRGETWNKLWRVKMSNSVSMKVS